MKQVLFIALLIIGIGCYSENRGIIWTAAWSLDDKYIAIGGEHGNLKLLDAKSLELIKSFELEDVIVSRIKWHPHEYKLAVITQSNSFTAKIVDLDNDNWIELEGLESSLRGLDWNHNGELLAVSEFEGEVSVFDSKGERVSRFVADPKSVTGIDWHPSKNIFAAVGSRIGIFNYSGDSINVFHPRDEEVFLLCVEWHKSGDFFATGDYGQSDDAKNKRIQFWNIEGAKLNEMKSSEVEYRNIRWSPDGKLLASANDALRIWDLNGKQTKHSKPTEDYLWGVDWNSDGSKIITTSANGVIAIWDKNGNLIEQLEFE